MSVAADLAAEIMTALGALSLSVGGQSVTWSQRKLPAVGEGLDPLPVGILTPPEEPDSDVPFDTGTNGVEGRRLHEYGFGVTLIAKGNRDLVNGLSDVRTARQAISFRFGRVRPLSTPGFLWLKIMPGAVIDRGAISQNYDHSGMGLRVAVVVTSS